MFEHILKRIIISFSGFMFSLFVASTSSKEYMITDYVLIIYVM